MWSISIRLKRPPCIAAQSTADKLNRCCNSRFSVRDSRTTAFGPHPLIQNKKIVENYFRFIR